MKTAGAGWIRLIEPVKRETGASPVRTRHRNLRVFVRNHWETGKEDEKRLSNQSGDLPFAVQERKVHATSNWQYER